MTGYANVAATTRGAVAALLTDGELAVARLGLADMEARSRPAPPPVARRAVGRSVSIVVPVYEPDEEQLRQAVRSVELQTWRHWELILVPDGTPDPATADLLANLATRDRRIRLAPSGVRGGISAATNRGLARASGAWVTFLDQDDLLTPHAIETAMNVLDRDPDAQVVYLDEAKLSADGRVVDVSHKPGWSPELLRCCMYLGHLVHYRCELVDAVGGLRRSCDGSQDWDLALRISETHPKVVHVPKIAYLWRQHAGSTSTAVGAKPWTVDAAARALADHVAVDGVDHHPEPSPVFGWFRPRRGLRQRPLVTVVMPTAGTRGRTGSDGDVLAASALRGLLERTDWAELEVMCMLGSETAASARAVLEPVADTRVRFQVIDGPFNFANSINRGALAGSGEVILLLNDDVEVLDETWLARLVEHATNPEVGAVGAVLVTPDGLVQHAGVHFRGPGPSHVHASDPYTPGDNGSIILDTNHLAVTGAVLATRRAVFMEVGGLQPAFHLDYNDVDYCLKVGRAGYRCVVAGGAVLLHHESATRGISTEAAHQTDRLHLLWSGVRQEDPMHPWPLDDDGDIQAFADWFVADASWRTTTVSRR